MVIPIKFAPHLFLIAGVYSVFSGEDAEFGSILTAVGAVWLFLRYMLKKSGGASAFPSATPTQYPVNNAAPHAEPSFRICPVCGNKSQTDSRFCPSCGTPLQ